MDIGHIFGILGFFSVIILGAVFRVDFPVLILIGAASILCLIVGELTLGKSKKTNVGGEIDER